MEPQTACELVCPRCQSRYRQVKVGKTVAGKPRFRCQDCQRSYVLSPQPRGLDPSLRRMAVRLYLEGNGFRRIGRLLGVNHQTVVNWIRKEEAQQPPAMQPAQSDIVEMDELYALHEKKGAGCTLPPA